tara:strand:- start:302 stop:526 length:225 start_codon:yes stop_codon:yes gene_type:complete
MVVNFFKWYADRIISGDFQMSNPSLSGGSSISLDDVLVMLFGSAYTGASTSAASGLAYLIATTVDNTTAAGKVN